MEPIGKGVNGAEKYTASCVVVGASGATGGKRAAESEEALYVEGVLYGKIGSDWTDPKGGDE